MDDSLHSIELNLWGSLAEDFLQENEESSSLIDS